MYIDFFCLPLLATKEDAYRQQALVFLAVMKEHGLVRYCEAIADDVPRGTVTDFYRAVAASDEETVVAAFAMWPDKATRDRAWAEAMKDPRMAAMEADKMVFDGKRMFWGGFRPLLDFDDSSR